MKKRCWIKKMFLAMVLLPALLVPAALSAEIHDSLVILPFTGSMPGDAEEFAYIFFEEEDVGGFRNPLLNVFYDISIVEERGGAAQLDTNSIIDAGYDYDASHVIAGHIATIDGRHIVLLSLIDIDEEQLVAGYYQQYRAREEVDIFEVARIFAQAASRDTSTLPRLYVPAPVSRAGTSSEEAAVLAQVLMYQLADQFVYGIFPIDYDPETENPTYEGITDLALFNTIKADGEVNTFTANIYDMAGLDHVALGEENYQGLTYGLTRMPRIALALTNPYGMEMLLRTEAAQAAAAAAMAAMDVEVEDPSIAKAENRERFWLDGGRKFWSFGLNFGTTFEISKDDGFEYTSPLGFANAALTMAPVPFTFFEAGAEIGTFLNEKDKENPAYDRAQYYQLYFYGSVNLFLPFARAGGFYLGTGAGYLDTRYILPDSRNDHIITGVVFEGSAGLFLGGGRNYLRLGYSARTPLDFESLQHRVSIGHALRFY
ncbi:MAG: hypothetical protein FWG89_00885 [Treponema sp.]|nr:hypothetical protein [Treponema sp.]